MSDFNNLPFGITRIDAHLHRPGLACFYMIEGGDEVAFIETGTLKSAAYALKLMELKQIDLEQVRYVIPTHVHLDHAGGAGELMRLSPNAELVIHPRGARHMIDPSKLWAGASAVYGEEMMRQDYGAVVPIDESRVIIAEDGHKVTLGKRMLEFRDTPGHADHHFCVWDETSKGWFTGDTFGYAYGEFNCGDRAFLLPATTPVQFKPEALNNSVDLLMSYQPERIFLTHFDMLEQPEQYQQQLKGRVDRYTEIALSLTDAENRIQALTDALIAHMLEELQQHIGSDRLHDTARGLLSADLAVNAQGLDVWLSRCKAA